MFSDCGQGIVLAGSEPTRIDSRHGILFKYTCMYFVIDKLNKCFFK